jgi:hypothetical protein
LTQIRVLSGLGPAEFNKTDERSRDDALKESAMASEKVKATAWGLIASVVLALLILLAYLMIIPE